MPITVTPRILSSRDLWRVFPRIKKVWKDWIYIGLHDEFNETKLKALVEGAFGDEDVYVVIDRNRSYVTKAANVVGIAREALERDENIGFCSIDVTRFVAVANVGVARAGREWKEGDVGNTF